MATITPRIGNALVVKGPAHLIIRALAGTGKTTVLVQLVRSLAQEQGLAVLTLAFAKRDRNTLNECCKGWAKVFTSNQAGLSILGPYGWQMGSRIEVNDDVSGQMLEHRWKEDGLIIPKEGGTDHNDNDNGERGRCEWKESYHVFSSIVSLVDKARSCLPLKMNHPGYKDRPTDSDFLELADRFDMEIGSDDTPTVLFYAQWLFTELASLKNALVWGVDLTGQVFLPVYHHLTPAKLYDVVMVDEAQDQSFANRGIAFLHLRPGTGRIIAVGDENQAIYAWRGADKDALQEMVNAMTAHAGTAPESFPLTLCRRCSQAVIAEAQKLVPAIQALPEAPEGVVDALENGEALFNELSEKRTGLVLCRANAPLVSMALRLLANRVPCALLRSNIVADLLRLIDKLAKHDMNHPITEVLAALEEWLADRLAKLAKRRNAASAVQVTNDKAACLRALAEEESIKTAGDLRTKIDELFPDPERTGSVPDPAKMVVFSTVHGAKGGEANTVYLYSPDGQKTCIFDQVWSDATDRDNTLYVAVTRAEYRLCYAGPRPSMVRFSTADLDETDLDLESLDFGDE